MKYDEKISELKKNRRIVSIIALAIGIIITAIILPAILSVTKDTSRLLVVPPLLLPAAIIAKGFADLFSFDKKLEKMWASVGFCEKDEITSLFDKRTVFDTYDGDYFIIDNIIVNLDSLKAYKTSDITNISKKDVHNSDSEGRKLSTLTYYINFRLNRNAAHKKDTMSFNSKNLRDSAYDMIFEKTMLK